MLWTPAGPPGRGENAPSQREPVGNIKAVSSFQTQHRLDFSMRTHAHYILANKEGSGYNKPVVQLCCCAECSLTRTGPWGAPTPCGLPQLCFRHNSTRYRKKLQEVFYIKCNNFDITFKAEREKDPSGLGFACQSSQKSGRIFCLQRIRHNFGNDFRTK